MTPPDFEHEENFTEFRFLGDFIVFCAGELFDYGLKVTMVLLFPVLVLV